MPELYIPLYYSNLKNFIPEDEEILYSAFYKVLFKESKEDFFKVNKVWDTHVLFTKKGFYFGEYQRKKSPKIMFISWHRVKRIKKKTIELSRSAYKLKIKREPNFETRIAYKTRKRDFLTKMQPLMNDGVKLGLTDFLEQSESLKKSAENEKYQLKKLFGDKYDEKFGKVMELIKLERYLRGEDKFGVGAFYKDIRKNKMKNQVYMNTIDLIVAMYALPLFALSIVLGVFMGLDGYTISLMISTLIISLLISCHWFWIKKSNFAIRKNVKFFAHKKTKIEQRFLESFSELPKNIDGFHTMRLMSLGSEAFQQKDFEKSVKIFQQILKIDTKLEMNWYMLLESLSYLARWEEIMQIGEDAIKMHPNFGPIYHWLADAYKKLGNKDKALEYYNKGVHILKKVLERDPNDDNTLNSLGYNYLRLGEYEKAVECYKKAIKIRPESEHHLHSLGQTYMKMGLYDKAIKYLEKSLEYNPNHSYSWFDLGLIYEDLDNLEKAIECFEKAVEYYPQWVKLREKLINLKPNSPVLSKKPQEVKEKTAGDDLYDILHTRRKEDYVKKYEANLERLQNMKENELIAYLTSLIYSYVRRIEKFKTNKRIPPFVIERMKIQKEYKEILLNNLREFPDYISKFRLIIENDIEFFKVRMRKNEVSREQYLESLFNLVLEMPYEQVIIYFKQEILIKLEMLKYKPMDDKETEMRNLALNYAKETLKNLEDNRSYMQIFRKEIKNGLDELKNGSFSVFNEKLYYLF